MADPCGGERASTALPWLSQIADRFRAYRPREPTDALVGSLASVIVGEASVLIPLYAGPNGPGDLRVLLTRRNAALRSHGGEVALPGGKKDADDADVVATALREAYEEVGLPPSCVDVVGTLDVLVSKHKLKVTPVVAVIPAGFVPTPNADEVDAVFDAPLDLFLRAEAHSHLDITWLGHDVRMHMFEHNGFNIFGLTAFFLIQTAEIAFGRPPEFSLTAEGTTPFRDLFYKSTDAGARSNM